ncbi:MAG: PepSY domain-containing protein [Rhizobiales bacterium]|nr:PepSY domain-containing protein [Hyphomicrobiales bacterium]MBI3673427.1 PepSY domain-containing protein [Hyphomicrobiales bacterium]
MSSPDERIGRRSLLLALLWVALAAPAGSALADDNGGGDGKDGGGGDGKGSGGDGGDDNDNGGSTSRIRDAVKSGAAEPLKDILAVVRQNYQGEVVSIALVGSANRMVYKIRMIDTDNRLIEIRVSAKSKLILSVKGI